MMTFDDYRNSYIRSNYKRLPDGQYCNPKKALNENQLATKYKKYVRKSETKEIKGNTKYVQAIYDIEAECRIEDPFADEFYASVATLDASWGTDYVSYFKRMNKMIGDIYDPAHILPRGANPRLASCKENIIMLPRFVHTLLDNQLEIFNEENKHTTTTKERHEKLWRLIVGDYRYDLVQQLRKEVYYG